MHIFKLKMAWSTWLIGTPKFHLSLRPTPSTYKKEAGGHLHTAVCFCCALHLHTVAVSFLLGHLLPWLQCYICAFLV